MDDSLFLSEFIASGVPIAGVAIDYPDNHVVEAHSHPCPQLLYAIHGVMRITAEGGMWVVPPTRAVWLQAGVTHQVSMCGAVRVRTVFVNPELTSKLPERSCVLDIAPLLRELIVAAVDRNFRDDPGMRDRYLHQLLLQELHSVPVLPLYLPMPQDLRLRSLCDVLMHAPDTVLTVDDWAEQLHMSTRNLHRSFQQQTGMRLGEWRRQARLLLALEQLASGARVVDVALNHGYASQSAFASMFKKHFGVSPTSFYK